MRGLLMSALVLAPALLMAQPAVASGSGGGGGGGGGGFGGGVSAPRDPSAEAFSRGRSVVSRRIACERCSFPNGVNDTVTARQVAERVRSGTIELSARDREMVLFYLGRRFGV